MKTGGVLLLFGALLLQAQSRYKVSGTIQQHNTGQAMNQVRITLNMAQSANGQQASVVTDKDGRFHFTDVPAGKYTLAAQWHGMTQLLRQDEQYSTAIVTGPGLETENIVFPFVTPGTVAVKVTDEEGEPVQNASVFLFRKGVFDGRHRFGFRGQGNTNSSGEHRFTNLPPDTYFLAAEGRPWYAQALQQGVPQGEPVNEQQRAVRAELNVAYPATFYSDSNNPEGAAPIAVAEASRTEVRVALRAVPAVQLEVTDFEREGKVEGPPKQGIMPVLMQEGPGGILFWSNGGGVFYGGGPTSSRTITGLAPGRYVISCRTVNFSDNGIVREPVGSGTVDLHSNTNIDVGQLPKTDIHGIVTASGPERPPRLTVALENLANRQFETGNTGADGAFRIGQNTGMNGGMQPGKYEIRLLNNPEFYIKSIAAKGAAFRSGILEVQEGAHIELSIVAAAGTIKMNGVAVQNGKPFAGAMVLLLPNEPGQGAPILRDQSDSDGSFIFQGAQPGSYTAVAIDDGSDLAYAEPATMRPYLSKGVPVELPAAQKIWLELPVQPRLNAP